MENPLPHECTSLFAIKKKKLIQSAKEKKKNRELYRIITRGHSNISCISINKFDPLRKFNWLCVNNWAIRKGRRISKMKLFSFQVKFHVHYIGHDYFYRYIHVLIWLFLSSFACSSNITWSANANKTFIDHFAADS